MINDRVLALFATLSGLSEDEVMESRYLCDMSMADIARMLPENTDCCGGKKEYAAAALAYYRYVMWSMTEAGTDVKVGDISVRSDRERLEYAERIWNEALSQLGEGLDDTFVFRCFS